MKHTVISIVLLAVILCFCIFSAFYVSHAVAESIQLLEHAQRLERSGNEHGAVQAIQAATARWKSHQVFFGTVLRHDEIDEVLSDFASLHAYAQNQSKEDFRSGCAALLARLKHIQQMEWPFFHNIM